jgi:glycosyltransferase involved in cell wall biosynthesis
MISIILVTRNGSAYLKDALDSIASQTWSDFKLLIVDDASEDCTPKIISRYKNSDERIDTIRNDICIGLTCSLNKAIMQVDSPWIARIDDDDTWHPEKLSKQMKFLASNPKVGLLGTAYKEMDEDGSNLRNSVLPLCQTDQEIREALYRFNPFFHSSIVARREIVHELGGYNERFFYAQDYELWVRLLHRTQAANLTEILCYRRMGDNNISVRKERAQRLNALKAKILWVRLNGFRKEVLSPVLRDLAVVLAPNAVKNFVRVSLRGGNGQ